MFLRLSDYIGNNVARIIVKAIIVAIVVLIEFTIAANATIPWLEGKEKPVIRRIKN